MIRRIFENHFVVAEDLGQLAPRGQIEIEIASGGGIGG